MAKNTTTASSKELEPNVPENLHMDPTAFDNTPGDSFGGQSDILVLDEEDCAGPLVYKSHRIQDMGNGLEPANVHEAEDTENKLWRLPIAANFNRNVEGANLKRGDTFAFKRLPDAIKKSGKGKGNPMQMYVIKVLSRAPVQSVESAN